MDEIISLVRRVPRNSWIRSKSINSGMSSISYIGSPISLLSIRVGHRQGYDQEIRKSRNDYSISASGVPLDIDLGHYYKSPDKENPIESLYEEIDNTYESIIKTEREECLRKARELIK